MNRSLLLAAVSALAFCSGGASAAGLPAASVLGTLNNTPKGAKILYNQNSNNSGVGILSDNFTSGSFTSYDDQAADDFVIPKGQVWTITQVDVSGVYFDGTGPATSEDVIFYKNAKSGEPGNAVKKGTFKTLAGTGGPGFALKLPGKGVVLKAGHYWVSVVANVNYSSGGEWGWFEDANVQNDSAVYRDAGSGWQSLDADLMFDLRGTTKGK